MGSFMQNPVSAAIWPWASSVEGAEALPGRPWAKLLISTVVGSGMATFALVRGHGTAASVIYCIVGVVVGSGLVYPPLYRRIERVFSRFALWVGTALTWILLVPFFFLVFPVGRVCLALKRRDPLNRACPTDEDSYWVAHRRADDPETRFRRQFG